MATQLPAQQAPTTQPAATKPAATKPAPTESQATPSATKLSVPRPPATQPVATPPVATPPRATNPVATGPVATPPLKAQAASLSPGNRTRRLHQLQTLVTQWLQAENDQAGPPVTAPDSPLSPAPPHPSLGLAKGPLGLAMGPPRVLAGDADLETGSPSVSAAPRRPEDSPNMPSVARPRAAMAPPIPQALHQRRRSRHGCRSVARLPPAAVVSARSHPPSWRTFRRSRSRWRRSCWRASSSLMRRGDRHCSRRDWSAQADDHRWSPTTGRVAKGARRVTPGQLPRVTPSDQ